MTVKDDPDGKRLSFVYDEFGPPQSTLTLRETKLPALEPGMIRVAMDYAPINPSDLIPVTGAYRQRISLPSVAGYEGIGRVTEAPRELSHMLGRRVMPLRGDGTWQSVVDCPCDCAVEVPDTISDLLGARAYINPLAALTMLRIWDVRGKVVLLTAAGSNCAEYLGRWARKQGARRVFGIYRSGSRVERLVECGIEPISLLDHPAILTASAIADITFDALGGEIASAILGHMQADAMFVAYGLMTGEAVTNERRSGARYHRFHLRDHLPAATGSAMRNAFSEIWSILEETPPLAPAVFAARDWRQALAETEKPGGRKPVLDFSGLRKEVG